jgi:hypothetical protein
MQSASIPAELPQLTEAHRIVSRLEGNGIRVSAQPGVADWSINVYWGHNQGPSAEDSAELRGIDRASLVGYLRLAGKAEA